MTILLKHHKRLTARGAHTRAGMLYKIATAQIYDGPRVCEHDPDAQVSCTLCGSPDDSMYHRAYDCPCTPTSLELDKTDRIVDEARTRVRSCPVFWFRGLPPSSWYPELPVAEQPFAEDFGSLDIAGGHVFTDGSRGTETKDPPTPPLWLRSGLGFSQRRHAQHAGGVGWGEGGGQGRYFAWKNTDRCSSGIFGSGRRPGAVCERHAASRLLDRLHVRHQRLCQREKKETPDPR